MGLGNKWVNVLLILMKDEKEAGFSWWEEEETRRHLLSGRGLLEWRAGRGRGGGGGKNEDPASWFSRVSLVYRLPDASWRRRRRFLCQRQTRIEEGRAGGPPPAPLCNARVAATALIHYPQDMFPR